MPSPYDSQAVITITVHGEEVTLAVHSNHNINERDDRAHLIANKLVDMADVLGDGPEEDEGYGPSTDPSLN
jgi:hypothetical protein